MPKLITYESKPIELPGYLVVRVWQRGGQMGEDGWKWVYIPAPIPHNDEHAEEDFDW